MQIKNKNKDNPKVNNSSKCCKSRCLKDIFGPKISMLALIFVTLWSLTNAIISHKYDEYINCATIKI